MQVGRKIGFGSASALTSPAEREETSAGATKHLNSGFRVRVWGFRV